MIHALLTILGRWFGYCGVYLPAILLLSGLGVLFLGVVFLWLGTQAQRRQRWAMLFGLSFVVFGARGLVRWAEPWMSAGTAGHVFWVPQTFPTIGSTLNNVLLWATARALSTRRPFTRCTVVVSLIVVVLTMALGHCIGSCPGGETVARLPDALFSAYCVGSLGYTMYVNMDIGAQVRRPHRNRTWVEVASSSVGAPLHLVLVSFYALLLVASAFRPMFDHITWSSLEHTLGAYKGPGGKLWVKTDSFDGMLVAFTLPPKLMLLVNASTLLQRARLVLLPEREATYLSSDGIVQAMCEGFYADMVELNILLSGTSTRRIRRLQWSIRQGGSESADMPRSYSLIDDTLKRGVELLAHDQDVLDAIGSKGAGMRTMLLVPIRSQEMVIGCLAVLWSEHYTVNDVTRQRIRLMADLLSSVVQEHRKLDVVSQCGRRFSARDSGGGTEDATSMVRSLSAILHDLLSPLETRLEIDIGFRSAWAIHDDKRRITGCGEDADSGPITLWPRANDVKHESIPLTLHHQGKEINIGTLRLGLPTDAREPRRAILGTDPLTQSLIAAHLTDAIHSSVQTSLLVVLGDLQRALRALLGQKKVTTERDCLNRIRTAAFQAGLSWVVAELPEGMWDSSDNEIHLDVVLRNLPHVDPSQDLQVIPAVPTRSSGAALLRMKLPITGVVLWLYVPRPGFGVELSFDSPWLLFLKELANTADQTLNHVKSAAKIHSIQIEAVQNLTVATMAVTTNMLIHEIRNESNGIAGSRDTLRAAQDRGLLTAAPGVDAVIDGMFQSAQKLAKITCQIADIKAMDARTPCSLREAADLAVEYLASLPKHQSARVDVNVDRDASVNAPFHVVFYSILNLLRNSLDAIEDGGKVQVFAEMNGKYVLFRVTDDGPGIDARVVEQLFTPDGSTKEGGGMGLSLVRHALHSYGGEAELERPGPGDTTFLLKLPKAEHGGAVS